jgi:hypothetical protein
MGLYEGIKDVAKIIQQADNIELYKQLIELSAQALDMQNEISRLSTENTQLKKSKDIESRIERHIEPILTLKDDSSQIVYCSHCWDYDRKLIQVNCYDIGTFTCAHCKNTGVYDIVKNKEYIQMRSATYGIMSNNRNRNQW